jgi:hypothetical protein
MRRDPPKKPDPLLLLAQASARKRRKRSPAAVLIALAVVVAGLALVVWLTLPGPEPGPLMVVALDQLALPKETVPVRGLLQPQEESDEPADLQGIPVYFAGEALLPPREKQPAEKMQEQVQTGADGEASVAWHFPLRHAPFSVVVTYPGDKHRKSSQDTGLVYTWPAQTNILLVEARYALMNASEDHFDRKNIFALAPFQGAPAALKQAVAKQYRVVYLATAPSRPADYRKLRGWLQRRLPPAAPLFPEGPALGREDYSAATDLAASKRAVMHSLKTRFRGKLVGVVRRAQDARLFRDAGVITFMVGGKDGPPEKVRQVPGWDQLVSHLP